MGCVIAPENVKPYAVFLQKTSSTVDCSFDGSRTLCCADVVEGNLNVYFVTEDNKALLFKYRVVTSEENGLSVVKLASTYDAFITLSGDDGMYLVEEELPKSSVASYQDVEFSGFVVNPDPIIAWVVEVNNGRGFVHYRLKRGSVPLTPPRVSLASCDISYGILSQEILRGKDRTMAVTDVVILYRGERVIPTDLLVLYEGSKIDYRVIPEKKVIEVFTPAEKGKEISFTVWLGDCNRKFTVPINVSEPSFPILWVVAGVVVALLLVYLLRRRE